MWKVVKKEICIENNTVQSYGIAVNAVEIHDISTDREEIEEFVRLLNRLGASEIHAYELVEDFLGR